MAGRGFGKTRTGVETTLEKAYFFDNYRQAVVAPTWDDVRKTCFEGESGLMSRVEPSMVKGGDYNKSLYTLELENGSIIQGFSADKPDRLRGPQFHGAWCDEICAWRYQETWEMLEFTLRLGDKPRVMITTTPKPTKLIKELVAMEGVHMTNGSTYENVGNLAGSFLKRIKKRYEGTRLGEQELMGALLTEVEGSLWKRDMIQHIREDQLPDLIRIVVGVDPAVTANPDSDETGIVVAGKGVDGDYYILDDLSGILSVEQWPKRSVNAYTQRMADLIVGETNNGGDLVERAIKFENERVNYKKVHASRGKVVRAEPIAQLYEKGRVKHVGMLGNLEDQMCQFAPALLDNSPDRVDALVWAMTELADSDETTIRIR
jgi:phage terminase large subunit-like protein